MAISMRRFTNNTYSQQKFGKMEASVLNSNFGILINICAKTNICASKYIPYAKSETDRWSACRPYKTSKIIWIKKI